MKLTYRGIRYDYTPDPAVQYGNVLDVGSYRGAPQIFRALARLPIAQPVLNLQWRGVSYITGTEAPVSTPVAAPVAETPVSAPADAIPLASIPPIPAPTPSIAEQARALLMKHHRMIRRREQAMLTRLDEEVGLTAADAARYEGHIQGKSYHDFGGYDRSGAAMS